MVWHAIRWSLEFVIETVVRDKPSFIFLSGRLFVDFWITAHYRIP